MLKDLRNEKLNNQNLELNKEDDENQISENETNESMFCYFRNWSFASKVASCWNAPAGAVIERGMMVQSQLKLDKIWKQ